MKSALKSLFGAQLLAASLVLAACSGLPQSSTSTGGSGTGAGFTIGGTVTGLTGTGLVLKDNGADNLTVSKSGAFTFPTSVASGAAYAVTVASQPTNPVQSCAVTGGSGSATANVIVRHQLLAPPRLPTPPSPSPFPASPVLAWFFRTTAATAST